MSGIAFIFPGQGSQYIGMGKDLIDKYPEVKRTFVQAEEILEKNYLDTCLSGPEERLKDTVNTQLCVYILSIGIYRVIDSYGFKQQIMAGHSLGEYSALTASQTFKFSDGLRIVAKRAELMSKEAKSRPGKMLAILGTDLRAVEDVVDKMSSMGTITIANYNCPGQIVISTDANILEPVISGLKEVGAKRVVELPVSGAFHSQMMANAEIAFKKFLDDFRFSSALVPVVPNTIAHPVVDAIELRNALQSQMTSSVKWQQSIEQMIGLGIRTFVEIGPGDVLSKIIRRIDKNVDVFPTDRPELFDKAIDYLKSVKQSAITLS